MDDSYYVIDENIRNQDIQRQIDEQIAILEQRDAMTRDDYTYTYSYKEVATKYVTRGGYAGGQPTGGVKFSSPGGAFYWQDSGGPSVSASVSFSVPVKVVNVSIAFGITSTSSGVGYIQNVSNTSNYVKLYIDKTMEVKQIDIYRTNIKTGATTLYLRQYPSTKYSHKMSVKVVR